jgi:CRP/FNR family cyclic AMP-dependent transcriptional regulator
MLRSQANRMMLRVGRWKEGEPVESNKTALDEARRLLGNCVLFRDLKAEERGAIIGRARIRIFAAGEKIFSIGAISDHMAAVLTGQVRISVPSPDGREVLLAILEAGEIIGEIAVLDGKRRTADATAVTSCALAILDRHEVLAFLEQHPGSWLAIVSILCERLRRTDEQLAEVALLSLPVRLAKAILRINRGHSGKGAHNNSSVHLSQRELANFVGATRESVNKCLKAWQRQGLIRIDDGQITVTDRTAFETLSGLD